MNAVDVTRPYTIDDSSYSASSPVEDEADLPTGFMRPDELVRDDRLSLSNKREILASWASDRHAIADAPGLRQLDNGAVLRLDDIIKALHQLDKDANIQQRHDASAAARMPSRAGFSNRLLLALRRKRSNDDDDPPPCPAIVDRPSGRPLTGGGSVEPDVLMVA